MPLTRGEWQPTEVLGWQHGRLPTPPPDLQAASREAWRVWFSAWFAAHWTPDDLPGLRQLVILYDQVQRGKYSGASEVRLLMDTYGITPKGQQDRRWARPKPEEMQTSPPQQSVDDPYVHLRIGAAESRAVS